MIDKEILAGALFSNCRRYRYLLWRTWDTSKPRVMFIGLNPSTANEKKNDNTITKVIKLAQHWGYGGMYMTNLFAWVSTDPAVLLTVDDALGDNDSILIETAAKCEKVVFAWGNFKQAVDRAEIVKAMFPNAFALHINKNGSPKHPLYCADNTMFIPYNSTKGNE